MLRRQLDPLVCFPSIAAWKPASANTLFTRLMWFRVSLNQSYLESVEQHASSRLLALEDSHRAFDH